MLCNDARLRAFLSAPEESGLYREVSQHVEKCHRCCERLLELSDAGELVSEACETLRQEGDLTVVERENGSPSVLVTIDSLQGTEVPIDFETIPLDFLAPASHPEMLGRLGRYEIEKVIGTGGMGIVLKGYDTELHRIVAIKVLLPHLANSGAARRRFSREAQSAAAVVHEHVIPIYNVEAEGDIPYLVMQYVSGQSLQGRVDEHGPLSVAEILRIGRQAAAGLAAAHDQGVVHRDVKPANLLLEESLDRVLISDFGLARTVDDATLTRTGIVAGTPHYMSPEQASGEVVDRRTDLFSLGSVLYFMATGRPPFRADSPMAILNRICHQPHRPVDEINSGIPMELADVIERLLAKAPAERFDSARAVEARLSSILSELQQGGRLRRRGWWRRWSRVVRNWRKAAQLASAGVLCILLGVFLSGGIRGPAQGEGLANAPAPTPTPALARAPAATGTGPANVLARGRQWPTVIARAVDADIDTFEIDLREAVQELAGVEEEWQLTEPAAQEGIDPWERERLAIEAALQTLAPERAAGGWEIPRWPTFGATGIERVPAAAPADESPEALLGQPAPKWEIEAWAHGDPLTQDALQGKVVLLDFWAVWCAPCLEKFPDLRGLYAQFHDQGLEIVGVTQRSGHEWSDEKRAIVRSEDATLESEVAMLDKFLTRHELAHPTIVTPRENPMHTAYGVTAIPHAVLIDRKGVVRLIRAGSSEADSKAIRTMVETLLKE